MPEALAHLRIVELSDDLQAAWCAKQFAAWGAEVVVVEPPAGHRLRGLSPKASTGDGAEASLLWEYLAASKRSLAASPDVDAADRERVRGLVAAADVLVTDWKPARLAAAGLGLESLSGLNPRLVAVHLSPFGLTGPYAEFEGTDLIAQAVSGLLGFNGFPDREPVKAAANVLAYVCGATAFIGAMAALRERRLSGLGQTVEVAQSEAIGALVPYLRTEYLGVIPKRTGAPGPGNDTYASGDGFLYFGLVAERAWDSFVLALGLDETTLPEELRTPESRAASIDRLKAFIAATVRDRNALEVFLALNTLRVTTGILFSPEDLIANPHLEARGFLHRIDHPELGRITYCGASGLMTATPMAAPKTAPEVGSWNLDSGIWGSEAHLPHSNLQPPTSAPPLRGLRVLDCTAAWIGTYATMLLGDLGADIIKVESPTRPDVWRGAEGRLRRPLTARPEAHHWNLNVNFNSVNRNKRALCLDLDTEKGRDIFLRLAENAGLVMDNYTPRVMSNFGLGYEDLRKVNEDVITASFSGFGAAGPWADFRAIGASTEMQAGWDALMGYPDAKPIMMGAMYADAITGLQMASMALVALEHRDRTGEGQRIEGSMFEAAVAYIGEELMRASLRPGETRRHVNRNPDMAPHGVFPCAGDDRWIAIAVRDDADWRRLVDFASNQPSGVKSADARSLPSQADGEDAPNPFVLSPACPEPVEGKGERSTSSVHSMDRPQWSTEAGRLAGVEELEQAISAWTTDQDAHDLMRRLRSAGVPAGVVQNTAEVLEDEHFKARGWFIPQTHPDIGTHRYNGFAWRFSRTAPVARNASPRLGEHSRQVLAGELGLSAAEIEALFAAGVTGEVLERAAEEQAAGG